VQLFMGVVVLLPALIALVMTLLLWRTPSPEAIKPSSNTSSPANTGRYIGMVMYFVGFVLSFALLAHQWRFYDAFEYFVDGIMANASLTLGFALGYALFWVAGRFDDESPLAIWLERIALGVAGMTLFIILLRPDMLSGIDKLLGNAFDYVIRTYSDPATWLLTLVTVIFGALAFSLLRLGGRLGELPDQRNAWQGWLMLMPNIIGFMIFFAGPLLLSFYLSFTDNTVGQVPNFIGFQNYGEILSLEFQTQTADIEYAQDTLSFGYSVLAEIPLGDNTLVIGAKDTLFWLSLRNTLMFCLLLVPLAVIPAMALSLILNSSLPGMKFFRAVYFLPSVAAVVGTALIWRWLYTPDIGYYNYAISSAVGFLNSTFGFAFADPDIQWLNDPSVVLFSMVLLAAWGLVGYNTVLFLAGLQGIPGVLYEAARIDGANRWQQFRNVTLPMLAPTTFFVLITTIVMGLQVFNEPYALFPSIPIPENATTSVYYLYRRGFFFFEFGYASSIAWVLFIIIFGITLIQFRLQRNDAYES
jgi:ABC-type sugar transport system permease subunit